MGNQFLKIKIIYATVIIFILLLISNSLIDTFEKKDVSNNSKFFPSKLNLENKLIETLDNYGIENNWIIKKKATNSKHDSLNYIYTIKVPKDIPILFLMEEFNSKFINQDVKLFSKEYNINGNASLFAYVEKKLKLQVNFQYDEKIFRKEKFSTFIITGFEDLSAKKKEELLRNHIPFGITLSINEHTNENVLLIKKYGKEYLLLIDDDIEINKYKLSINSSISRLKKSVTNISKNYNDAVLFLIDKSSKLYQSAVFNFLFNEFKEKNRRLYLKEKFININERKLEQLESLLNFYIEDEKTKSKVFITSNKIFDVIFSYLIKREKKGNSFVLPSQYMKNTIK